MPPQYNAPDTTVNACQQVLPPFKTLGQLVDWFSCTLVKSVVPLLLTLAMVLFIWGIIQFFLSAENEEKRKKGKTFMMWGLISLFVMISMWGIVNIFSHTFGIQTLIPRFSQ